MEEYLVLCMPRNDILSRVEQRFTIIAWMLWYGQISGTVDHILNLFSTLVFKCSTGSPFA